MTRIALLLGDGAHQASLSAVLGENVRIIDDILQAESELVVAAVPPSRVVASIELGCADFVTLPCGADEVSRVVASLLDSDTCEEAAALLGEAGRGTVAILHRLASEHLLVVRGEKGTGVVAFARYWAGLLDQKVRVVAAIDLAEAKVEEALVVTGMEMLDGAARANAWTRIDAAKRTTRVALAVCGTDIDPKVDESAAQVLVPPMKERIADVARIVHAFEHWLTTRRGYEVVVPMRSLAAMQSYSWPNQLPELRATVDSLCGSDTAPASRGTSSEYRVPVQSEEVTLHLSGGVSKVGSLFWPSEVEFRESLESGDSFFPMNVDGKIQIVARAAVEAFGIPQVRDSVAWESEALAKRVKARLHMQSGASYEGEFVYAAAQARARVADFLNGKDRYFLFRLRSELLHVSKEHVVWVEELR